MNKELLDKTRALVTKIKENGGQVSACLTLLPLQIESSITLGYDDLTIKYYKKLKKELEAYGIYENNEIPPNNIPDELKCLFKRRLDEI